MIKPLFLTAMVATFAAIFSPIVRAETVIRVSPAESPFETSVASAASLDFNVQVEDGEEPAVLGEQTTVLVAAGQQANSDGTITISWSEQTWTLPSGFQGGQRSLGVSVSGAIPAKPWKAELTLALSGGVAAEVPFAINVRPGFDKDEDLKASVEFCVPREKGCAWGGDPNGDGTNFLELYRDFGAITGVGVFRTPDADPASIAEHLELKISEMIGGEPVLTTAIQASNVVFLPMDPDGNGVADFVQTTFVLGASDPLAVAPDAKRTFVLYVRRTDTNPESKIRLAWFEVRARETGDGGNFWLAAESQYADFGREQTPALKAKPVLYKNGTVLSDTAQATAFLEPSLANGYADPRSGLYDLNWVVRIDWTALKKRAVIAAGDTIRVDLTFPGTAVQTISASFKVIEPGVQATTFKTPDELRAKVYDNGKSEWDYLQELLEALRAAGLRVDGTGIHIPSLWPNPSDYPNWKDIKDKIDSIRAALKAYLRAARLVNGTDALDGKDEWAIDVLVEIDGVMVRVRIVIGKDGAPAKADDKNSDRPTLVIPLGRDGKPATSTADGTDGQGAEAKIEKKGSVGIAVGGDGGKGEEGTANADGKKGGSGGGAKVDVDNKKDPSTTGLGNEGVAIGGNGGDGRGKGGNGGDVKATAEKGSNAKVGGFGGDGGDSKWPPKGTTKDDQPPVEPRAGKVEVKNEDGVKNKTDKKLGAVHNNGVPGKPKGGAAVGTPGQPADGAEGKFVPGTPITGG